jgi:hypothetical protein
MSCRGDIGQPATACDTAADGQRRDLGEAGQPRPRRTGRQRHRVGAQCLPVDAAEARDAAPAAPKANRILPCSRAAPVRTVGTVKVSSTPTSAASISVRNAMG